MKQPLPEGFTTLSAQSPDILIDLKYCTDDNLVGRPLQGYASNGSAVITHEAAQSLVKIANHLQQNSVKKQLKMTAPALIIWDAYRPLQACEDFWQWSQTDCEKMKAGFYPNIQKRDFFKLGYIARQSSHCRGSTVDLNIVDRVNGKLVYLEMGTGFDFMDPLSSTDNRDVSDIVYQNRQFLKNLMNEFHWQGILQEWWHFTFTQEPFPETYFDFPVLNYEE